MADVMRDNFNEVVKKYGLQNQPKRLVVDGKFKKEFTANGKKYIVFPPEMVFNFDKQIAFQNIGVAFRTFNTPYEMFDTITKIHDYIMGLMVEKGEDHKKQMHKLVTTAANAIESFKQTNDKLYPPGLFMCTLFILREGEDMANPWSWESALEKINDWSIENLSFYDFFTLANSSLPD